MDKAIHCYSLGRQRNIDVLEMVRIARGVDDATHRPRAVGLHGRQLELAAPARRADAPGDHGVRGPQPGRVHHAVHAGRRDGAGDPGRRARRAERRGAGRDGPDPGGQPGRAGHLRRVHLERRHAVGRAGVRDAGVHADRDDRRPAGAALRRAVSLVQRQRRERARRAGGLRVGLLAVGRDHGRGQPADARRRLDGGRPPRQLREDDPRRRAARDGRGVPRPGRRRRGHARLRGDAGGRAGRPLLRRRAHPVALQDRVPQADAQRLAQLRDLGGGRLAGAARRRRTGSGRSSSRRTSRRRWTRPSARSSTPSSRAASPRAASPPTTDGRAARSRESG